jgi:hypothetical protein
MRIGGQSIDEGLEAVVIVALSILVNHEAEEEERTGKERTQ